MLVFAKTLEDGRDGAGEKPAETAALFSSAALFGFRAAQNRRFPSAAANA